MRRALVASPAYLEARGEPAAPSDLIDHDLIAFEGLSLNGEWRFGPKLATIVRCEPRLMTDSVDAAIAAAVDGVGVTRCLSYQADPHVAEGRLRYVLAAFEPPPWPVQLVYQANRVRSPNVRAFLDEARRTFREAEWGSG